MFDETIVVVRMLLADNSDKTIVRLREDVGLLKIRSAKSRTTVTREIVKRFNAMPTAFWTTFLTLPEPEQRLALFFVLLKTYPLLFHLQTSLALPKYGSIDRQLSSRDVLLALEELGAADPLVDSWTDLSKQKIASTFVTMLRQAGLIDPQSGELAPAQVSDDAFIPYVRSGELWFLQVCFLPQYKVQQIKHLAL